jgi:hypothetical protein
MSDDEPAKFPRGQMLTVGGASAVAALLSVVREADAATPMGLDYSGTAEGKRAKIRAGKDCYEQIPAWEVLIVHNKKKIPLNPAPDVVYHIASGVLCGYNDDIEYDRKKKYDDVYFCVYYLEHGPALCPAP